MSLITYLQQMPVLLVIMALLGLIMGSFFNVVVYRLPMMLYSQWHKQATAFLEEHPKVPELPQPYNLFFPHSSCPHCHQPIRAWQNIPVISFILLRGKCAYCHEKIHWRYPCLEIVTALLAMGVTWYFGWSYQLIPALVFTGILLVASFIDLENQLLPDGLTLSLMWLGLLSNAFYLFVSPVDAIIGGFAGYASLYLVAWGYYLITGREGIGFGDFKLLAALGAWVGWQLLPFILLLASFTGSIIGLVLMLFYGHTRHKPIPFGPYLALAGFIALLWGQELLAYYLHIFI